MKYEAIFDTFGLRLTEMFESETEAQDWLDERNNNLEYRTDINFVDDDGKTVDGYIYTQ